MKKRILSALLALTLIVALAAVGSPAYAANKPITFKFAMVDNEQSNYYKGAQAIAASVEEATQGAIYIPEMAILDQAFLWDSQDQANYAVQNELGALINEKAEALGIHVIGYMESGFRDVFSKKPIQSIDDFKGVKIRTMQNQGQLAAFTSFGANPVALAAGEQFTALQQGTIDACENAVSNCWVNKFYEAGVNSVTTTHHSFVYIPLCMSDNAWNQIPDDLKETFVEAVWAGCEQQWQFLNEANEEAVELLKGVGVSFYDIDLDSLKEAYAAKVEADGTTYDEAWVAAVEAARAAVK